MNKFIRITSPYIPLFLMFSTPAKAVEWSTTELQYQYGHLAAPQFAGGISADTNIFTLQHASGWSFGDVFFFIDSLHDHHTDGINDHDLYGELYVNFSLGKLFAKPVTLGAIKDVGLLAGFNAAKDAKVRKYLPGIRLSWNVPGFAFLNTDFMAYLDDSSGITHGGAPKESDSYLIDVNWAHPFTIASQNFSFEGHVEYAGNRHNEFGAPVSYWVLAQPQFRWDAGKLMTGKENRLYVGIEYQYWRNKLGDNRTIESRPQFLAVWRF
ncbi:nucleoside-specific channel-forming protein, Tsx [mine drainage metagenome]|uniref:Nucleoside-specific channel-forming protein, Tsx n=1 Tax=mine drainage metagenome TaxID=410659 RepID=A0A1J5SLR6_9ZZZZ